VDISFFKETFKSQDSNVRDEEDSFNRIAFSAVLEKYMPSYHSIAPYVGVGAGYERSKEVDQDSGEPKDSKQECVTTRSAFDVVGVAGFQWFFTEGLSLGGEYSGTFFFGSGKEESTYDAGTTTTTDEYSNSGLTWEAFSVYFSVKF
jgi:opacity protein-like surface antigen